MTEEHLRILGFEKETDESDSANPFYYYILDVTPGLSFITQPSDEVENEEWTVEMFEVAEIKIKDFKELSTLLEILNQNKDER